MDRKSTWIRPATTDETDAIWNGEVKYLQSVNLHFLITAWHCVVYGRIASVSDVLISRSPEFVHRVRVSINGRPLSRFRRSRLCSVVPDGAVAKRFCRQPDGETLPRTIRRGRMRQVTYYTPLPSPPLARQCLNLKMNLMGTQKCKRILLIGIWLI